MLGQLQCDALHRTSRACGAHVDGSGLFVDNLSLDPVEMGQLQAMLVRYTERMAGEGGRRNNSALV